MFDFAVKFILSLVVSHWVFSETCLLVPGFKDFAVNFYQTVRIPTHNEWPEIASSDSALALNDKLDEGWTEVANVLNVDPKNFLGVFSPKIRGLWKSGKQTARIADETIPDRQFRVLPDTSQAPFKNAQIIRVRFASHPKTAKPS